MQVFCSGPVNLSQNGQTPLTMPFIKAQEQFFLHYRLKHLPSSLRFAQLSSTIDWQVMELHSGMKIAANVEAQNTNVSYTGIEGVI